MDIFINKFICIEMEPELRVRGSDFVVGCVQ